MPYLIDIERRQIYKFHWVDLIDGSQDSKSIQAIINKLMGDMYECQYWLENDDPDDIRGGISLLGSSNAYWL